MEYMNMPGFLGTRAPFFMDVVTVIVALLPFLIAGAIYLARIQKYKHHAMAQRIIFIASVIVLTYFETGARFAGGFDVLMQGSSVSHNYAFIVLVFHIGVAVATLIMWVFNLLSAKRLLKIGKHKKVGYAVFTGVVGTSLTGLWVYALLFIY
jgi:putative membrane protein